jgi:hypothetical protein
MLSSVSWIGCAATLPNVPADAATTQCQTDCVQVSKAFVKKAANIYDELIRMKAALKICQERH